MNYETLNRMRASITYEDSAEGTAVTVSPPYAEDLEFFYDMLVTHSIDYFVWEFHNAPPLLRAMSQNGGDEDWVVVSLSGEWQSWIDRTDTGNDPAHYTCEIYPELNLHIWIGSHA